ncbi:hypothetical protein N8364_03540 [Saprospiraceae bacterium]|nr:hypothetical protein [Saprospiraceae bacterium]
MKKKIDTSFFFINEQSTNCCTGPALQKMEFHALKLNEVNSSEVAFFNLNDPAKFGRYTFLKKKRISTKLHNFIILDN